jgi:predicted DsbA family dithiol-disulfide isomerase
MQIDVISDTICPWCYIGKKRLDAALAQRPELDIDVVFRPYQLNPDTPREGLDRKDHVSKKFGNKEQAKQVFDNIAKTGKQDGIDFDFTRQSRLPNTLDSHRLNHWAHTAGVQDAVVEKLFERYFLEGDDIGDPAILLEVAKEAGMETEVVERLLQGDADEARILEEESVGRNMGVTGVPCFIIDKKYALVGAQDTDMLLRAIDQAVLEAQNELAGNSAAE